MRTAPFVCDPDSFFFPLDRIANWNACTGKRALSVPVCIATQRISTGSQALLEKLEAVIARAFSPSQRFGPEGQGILSFPLEGFTLTMDFPLPMKGFFFLDRLDEIVVRHRVAFIS